MIPGMHPGHANLPDGREQRDRAHAGGARGPRRPRARRPRAQQDHGQRRRAHRLRRHRPRQGLDPSSHAL